jgi:hypothetical protein
MTESECYDKIGRLSERERIQLLRAFDEMVPRIPAGSATEVDRELSSIRQARRGGGRRHAS